ncbi:11-beta-hydroxysteroid dehydrogenase-like 6 [Acorus gramineus]|uniref:11-beta-hydroxysteroid dehydrogenase-like 6 n=1 Tax=Acorus gramineus TaxID=55184 RepID=A0AAV8ZZY6_ACOGR|nr:11-beta-hydroxysteroid dehydrogenase-like 6 [Acorus gramineus]
MPRMSFYLTSKAALINFYETLRLEFGQEIGITIVTPGWIDSERFSSKEGKMRAENEIEVWLSIFSSSFLIYAYFSRLI